MFPTFNVHVHKKNTIFFVFNLVISSLKHGNQTCYIMFTVIVFFSFKLIHLKLSR